jgi:hypothetical protein
MLLILQIAKQPLLETRQSIGDESTTRDPSSTRKLPSRCLDLQAVCTKDSHLASIIYCTVRDCQHAFVFKSVSILLALRLSEITKLFIIA